MEIITFSEANKKGLKKYFTGNPCAKGHIAERYTAGACVECVSLRKKEQYLENREAKLAYEKVRGAIYRAENKEKVALKNKNWKQNNPDKVTANAKKLREQNPEKFNAAVRKSYYNNLEANLLRQKNWRKLNRGCVNYHTSKYKADKLKRTPKWLTDFDKLKIQCIYSIAAMLTRENKEPWHVDHIIPMRGKLVSGLHVPSNLQPMRGVENVGKKNKYEVVF
jgi:hypothetical protein